MHLQAKEGAQRSPASAAVTRKGLQVKAEVQKKLLGGQAVGLEVAGKHRRAVETGMEDGSPQKLTMRLGRMGMSRWWIERTSQPRVTQVPVEETRRREKLRRAEQTIGTPVLRRVPQARTSLPFPHPALTSAQETSPREPPGVSGARGTGSLGECYSQRLLRVQGTLQRMHCLRQAGHPSR